MNEFLAGWIAGLAGGLLIGWAETRRWRKLLDRALTAWEDQRARGR